MDVHARDSGQQQGKHKLARVAFGQLRNQSEYEPHRRLQTQSLMSC